MKDCFAVLSLGEATKLEDKKIERNNQHSINIDNS
jgi:hypothetical protein